MSQISGFIDPGYQPFVDRLLDYLVEVGVKSEVWAKRDRLSEEWHYFAWKMTFFETGMSYGLQMEMDDPRWLHIIEVAIDRMVDAGATTITPVGVNSQLVRQLEMAREDYLSIQEPSEAFLEDQRRRDREAVQKAREDAQWSLERIEANIKRKQEEGMAFRAGRIEHHRTILAINGYSREEIEEIIEERYGHLV